MRKNLIILLISLMSIIFVYGCEEETSDKCSKDNLTGKCDGELVCSEGSCVEKGDNCSSTALEGYCEGGLTCKDGVCVDLNKACSETNLKGFCEGDNLCIEGECKSKLSLYRVGLVGQTIEKKDDEKAKLLDEYKYYTITLTGRKEQELTNDAVKCINENSCWSSPDMKYFLYLVKASENTYTLKIAKNNKGNVNFAGAKNVTEGYKTVMGGIKFLTSDTFIFIKNKLVTRGDKTYDIPFIFKYTMSTNSVKELAMFAVETLETIQGEETVVFKIGNNFVLSNDGKYIFFGIPCDYDSCKDRKKPVDVYKIDLENLTDAEKIYEYARVNPGGFDVKYGVTTNDNKTLVLLSLSDNKHRIHIIKVDGSSLVDSTTQDPVAAPLGEYIGPDYNACADVVGTQICDIKSQLYLSKDGKSVLYAGKVGKWSELSDKINLYKLNIADKSIENLTAGTTLEDSNMEGVVFSPELGIVTYLNKTSGYVQDNTPWYLDLNSDEVVFYNKDTYEYEACNGRDNCMKTFSAKAILSSRESKELKIELLKP